MSETVQSRGVAGKAKGWFLEFRLIPVLLWSFTSVALGTALARWQTGAFDPWLLALAMALAGLVQGWVTHSINEIYDWRSGTDRDLRPRALSGGSKVRNLNLLAEGDLWTIFGVSSALVGLMALYVALTRAAWLVLLIASGYGLGVAYTLPPVATAYRPFLGEWLGGFPGVLLAGLGAYAIQAVTLSWLAVVALSAHALVCTAMLVVHHYRDAPSDAAALPQKRTTVVWLGPAKSRWYATWLAASAAAVYGILALVASPVFLLGVVFTVAAVVVHAQTDLVRLVAVTRSELRVIQLGIAAGLSVSVVLAPPLWPLLPLAAFGYAAHLWMASPPPELARAWRRSRRASAEGGNSEGPLSGP